MQCKQEIFRSKNLDKNVCKTLRKTKNDFHKSACAGPAVGMMNNLLSGREHALPASRCIYRALARQRLPSNMLKGPRTPAHLYTAASRPACHASSHGIAAEPPLPADVGCHGPRRDHHPGDLQSGQSSVPCVWVCKTERAQKCQIKKESQACQRGAGGACRLQPNKRRPMENQCHSQGQASGSKEWGKQPGAAAGPNSASPGRRSG